KPSLLLRARRGRRRRVRERSRPPGLGAAHRRPVRSTRGRRQLQRTQRRRRRARRARQTATLDRASSLGRTRLNTLVFRPPQIASQTDGGGEPDPPRVDEADRSVLDYGWWASIGP